MGRQIFGSVLTRLNKQLGEVWGKDEQLSLMIHWCKKVLLTISPFRRYTSQAGRSDSLCSGKRVGHIILETGKQSKGRLEDIIMNQNWFGHWLGIGRLANSSVIDTLACCAEIKGHWHKRAFPLGEMNHHLRLLFLKAINITRIIALYRHWTVR